MDKKRIRKIIGGMEGRTVIVLGDLMVDEYIFGETSRISREAPVLILKQRRSAIGYGGAANAVGNIRALGGNPVPVGIVGDDRNGRSLLAMLEKDGISTDGIIVDPDIATTSKTRVMAGGMHTTHQQIVRIDREPTEPYEPKVIIERTKKMIDAGADAMLVSDYGCGVLSAGTIRFVNNLKGKNRPLVAIDSRYQLKSYRNADLLAPNEEEAGISEGHGANDLKKIESTLEKLRAKLKGRALMVTRGSEGLSLFVEGKKPQHIPVYGSKVAVDTTGAGDTVVSTALLALCAGGTYSQAAYLSNRAGGLVVMKKGAATISRKELEGTL